MREVLAKWRPVIDEAIEDVLPREIDSEYLVEFFGPPSYGYDIETIQRGLADPVWELLDRGGKRWRSILFLKLVEAFGKDPEDFLLYATIPEILHTGTIIVDDVEDDAELRRGEPALHTQYGTDVALNAGNALYFIPLKLINKNPADLSPDRRLQAYEMLTHELNRTHLGQGMDIQWHNRRSVDVDESQYLEMCACKTGCLARIVARLAATVTGQSRTVERKIATYAERMSISFQIIDDVLDIEHTLDQAGEFGKAFGNDIREGKVTLIMLHATEQASPETASRLQTILHTDTTTEAEILEAIEIIQETHSVEYSRHRAEELAQQARAALDDLDLEPEAAGELAEFTQFMVDRDV
ncbi:MAG: polyprenyl synthetase family protein [Halobacteriales archaeon]